LIGEHRDNDTFQSRLVLDLRGLPIIVFHRVPIRFIRRHLRYGIGNHIRPAHVEVAESLPKLFHDVALRVHGVALMLRQFRVVLQHVLRNGLSLIHGERHQILVPVPRVGVDNQNTSGGRRRVKFVFIARHLPRLTRCFIRLQFLFFYKIRICR